MKSGWKDFVDTDHPDTNCPREMASAALLYLGFEADCWKDETSLIIAVFAFLKEHCGNPILDYKTLSVLIKKTPVVSSEIVAWFKEAYPVRSQIK
jgi:hypothetical protein